MILISWLLWSLSVSTFIVPFLIHAYIYREQDLKKKYGAKWAVVTGASSGIGRALTVKLAKQGINVVMVALNDDLLTTVHEKMEKDFPNCQFRRVGVNFGKPGYMDAIVKATADISPNLIFNNAGYILSGHFADGDVQRQLSNIECNAISAVKITHHFANRMIDSKQRGAITFTSSPAGWFSNPSAVMYGATKAFLTNFATSVAPELYLDSIDVLVVHPSPVDTGFYSDAKAGSALAFFKKTATSPELVAGCFFSSLGRTVVHNQGYFGLVVGMILKAIDVNLLANIIRIFAPFTKDITGSKLPRGDAAKKES